MRKLTSVLAAAAVFTLTNTATPVFAQSDAQNGAQRTPRPFPDRQTVIAINPFLVLFGGISGEYEQALTNEFVFAASGTYVPASSDLLEDRDHYGALEAKLRYYTGGRGPVGFAFGAGIGYVNYDFDSGNNTRKGPSFGFELTHNWVLGAQRHFVVGSGLGLKRVFAGGSNSNSDVIPSARLHVGFAF